MKKILLLPLLLLLGGIVMLLAHPVSASSTVNLTVFIKPDGDTPGTVTSSPSGINCPGTCSYDFPANTNVTLTRTTTDPTTKFKEWDPYVSGTICTQESTNTGTKCTFNMGTNSIYQVTAAWVNRVTFKGTVYPSGVSAGSFTLNPGGHTCSTSCEYSYGEDVSVTVTTTTKNPDMVLNDIGYGFSPCGSGSSSCTFSVTDGQYLDVDWDWKTYFVPLDIKGTGSGKVTSSPSGMSCNSDCTGTFNRNTSVTFTATPSAGSHFAGWGTQDEGGYLCIISYGKGGSPSPSIAYSTPRMTTSTCTEKISGADKRSKPLVAYFDKNSGSSSSGTTSANQSSTATPAAQPNTNNAESAKKAGITNFQVNHQDIYKSNSIPNYASDQPLVLSGKTTPNATVTLIIHSDPKTVTTTADKDGNWSYTITGLAPGNHYVEAKVTDPKTKKTSKLAKLLSFTVTAAKAAPVAAAAPTASQAKKSGHLGLIIVVLIILSAAVGGGWYWWKRRPNSNSGSNNRPPEAPALPGMP